MIKANNLEFVSDDLELLNFRIAIDSETRSRQSIHIMRQNAKGDRGRNKTKYKHQLLLGKRFSDSEDSSGQEI